MFALIGSEFLDTKFRMARSRKDAESKPSGTATNDNTRNADKDSSSGKMETESIRVDKDLAYMLSIIGAAKKKSVAELVSPILRPVILEMFAETIGGLNAGLKK